MISKLLYLPGLLVAMMVAAACSGNGKAAAADSAVADAGAQPPPFSADSAYAYVAAQVAMGPRVPNTPAHARTADWLVERLKASGADVTEQTADLRAFDGTILKARNILARFNPDAERRLLLLAHWDCRPWADEDPDPAKHSLPVDGANDGASGTGVLLEIARQLQIAPPKHGVDILLVDAEDWGSSGSEDSWALGAQHFVSNPPIAGYQPSEAILLDMVGGTGAQFRREYFSEQAAPHLNDALWSTAAALGYSERFPNRHGAPITDDHVMLIEAGIPAVDIIEYYPGPDGPFNPRWHTTADNMEGISAETLGMVGTVVMTYLRDNY
ncbi:MAG: M28 family peptidase [Muribaculaceae bacterium]|nr:M28 family peptidase [Muribaculaceae bacterium]